MAKHVPVILGSLISSMCNAEGPLVKDGPVVYCMSPIPKPRAGSYMFVSMNTIDEQLEINLRYSEGRGWNKIAFISSTDASGQAFTESFERMAGKASHRRTTVVLNDHVSLTDTSMAAIVARVKAAAPDVIYAFVTGTGFGTLLRDLQAAGVDLPVICTSADANRTQLASYASLLPQSGLYFTSFPPQGVGVLPNGPMRSKVMEYLEAMRSHGVEVDVGSFGTWDPFDLILGALRKYGTDATAEQIRSYIANYVGIGLLGQYNFPARPQRGLDPSAMLTVKWDKARQDFTRSASSAAPLRELRRNTGSPDRFPSAAPYYAGANCGMTTPSSRTSSNTTRTGMSQRTSSKGMPTTFDRIRGPSSNAMMATTYGTKCANAGL